MIKVGIIGASGYTGAELTRLLSLHPETELVLVTSRQYAGQPLAAVYPHLRDRVSLLCENPEPEALAEKADLFFAAVPHQTAMAVVPPLLAAGKKVIDLSADFRLRDVTVYEQWYQQHSAKDLIPQAVYGLPERYRREVATTKLVANPGCYPTSILLGLLPALENQAILAHTLIADSKSGTSGAGRSASLGSLFCEVHDGFRPYKAGRGHRHTPEIEQEISALLATPVKISFTPHLLPLSRGILSTIYAELQPGFDAQTLHQLYQERYREEPFVRVLELGQFPATQHVRGSNYCDVGLAVDQETNRVTIMAAIDNIVKGAAGQAIQNMNLMYGWPEDTGLKGLPLFP